MPDEIFDQELRATAREPMTEPSGPARAGQAATPTGPAEVDFVAWARQSALRPAAFKGTYKEGEVLLHGHLGTADAQEVSTFPSYLKAGDSVKCWAKVPGGGALYLDNCYATGEVAGSVVALARDGLEIQQRVRARLRCLGTLKVYATTLAIDDDEDRGTSYKAAYLIESMEPLSQPLPDAK